MFSPSGVKSCRPALLREAVIYLDSCDPSRNDGVTWAGWHSKLCVTGYLISTCLAPTRAWLKWKVGNFCLHAAETAVNEELRFHPVNQTVIYACKTSSFMPGSTEQFFDGDRLTESGDMGRQKSFLPYRPENKNCTRGICPFLCPWIDTNLLRCCC